MRYIVAVSGGIDSVVLLHQLVQAGEHTVIVAHFDHGIRPESAADARFVEALAEHYGVPFVGRREELGPNASEERARTRRYVFLRQVAVEYQATLTTAHHADDVVETIAINIQRGTGWRGVAVLNAPNIVRPLLEFSKEELRCYALEHRLEWVEDSSNASLAYLRNRLRRMIQLNLDAAARRELGALRAAQVKMKGLIDAETRTSMTDDATYERYAMIHIDEDVASELLQAMISATGSLGLTRPQRERALLAIKTAKSGTRFDCGGGLILQFSTRNFTVCTTNNARTKM